MVSPNGVWKVLCRHGLNTRAKRLGLIAGYAAPYEPPRDPGPEQHIEVSAPGELVGIDCFYVGRLKGTEGAIWQLTAIDIASSYAWAELVICKQGNPTARQTSKLAERVAKELKAAGWKLQRMLSDNGNEFRGVDFMLTLEKLGARHSRIHAGRPQTNGNVEALHNPKRPDREGMIMPDTADPRQPPAPRGRRPLPPRRLYIVTVTDGVTTFADKTLMTRFRRRAVRRARKLTDEGFCARLQTGQGFPTRHPPLQRGLEKTTNPNEAPC